MTSSPAILTLGFEIPGPPHPLAPFAERSNSARQLTSLGQQFAHVADVDSTAIAITAARSALSQGAFQPKDIALVVTAPTLLGSYGLEIPAVAICAALGLANAETINLAQGCVGFLTGLRLAKLLLADKAPASHALVVTACRASTLMDDLTHGGFYWGDGAAAAVIGTAADGADDWHITAYAEKSSETQFGAMRIPFGDAIPFRDTVVDRDLRITIAFEDARAQSDYIAGEQSRCTNVIKSLLEQARLAPDQIEAVFIPSVGRNRIRMLFESYPMLISKIESDFRYAHMGGVDVPFFFANYLNRRPSDGGGHVILLSPAFTAQWAGILLSRSGTPTG